ncbi:hypothetical protein BYT27DRAFT_7110992 [Phlegmacium glaucopus]|nr:hypothetical protein BYT27DRAFT_7110992 [Phlegmacium glaucopus]
MGVFDDYSAPSPQAAYSTYYFSSLNFQHTLNLELPVILSPSYISKWSFSPDISSSGASVVIIPGEDIPHIDDLQPILNKWAVQFSLGACSVNITFVSNDSTEGITKTFHFSKVNPFMLELLQNGQNGTGTSNRKGHWPQHVCYLAHHFTENNCLSPSLLSQFLQQKIMAPISGFRITMFPLAELGCLLHNEWLEEDLANALLELLYFHLVAKSSTGTCPFLILPALFLTQHGCYFSKIHTN